MERFDRISHKINHINVLINARPLIGQSAMNYCAGKLSLLNYFIKAKDHKFLWFI